MVPLRCGCGDAGAKGHGDLNAKRAFAAGTAGTAVDQDRLAGLQAQPVKHLEGGEPGRGRPTLWVLLISAFRRMRPSRSPVDALIGRASHVQSR